MKNKEITLSAESVNMILSINRENGFFIDDNNKLNIRLFSILNRNFVSHDQYLWMLEEHDKAVRYLTSQFTIAKEMIIRQKEEIATLKQYGSIVNPYDVLHELYHGGTIARGNDLISQANFKGKNLDNIEVRRWITWFEYHDIIKFNGQLRVAKYTWHKAKHLTREALKKRSS